jgi:anti-sigma B factor antagonist
VDPIDPQPSELATLEIGWRGTLVVGRLEGEVDLSNAAALEARISAALRDAPALVLDLTDVSYLDSAGLALLSRVQLACRRSGIGSACVLRDGSRTARTLELAGLELAGMRLVRSIEEAERLIGSDRG